MRSSQTSAHQTCLGQNPTVVDKTLVTRKMVLTCFDRKLETQTTTYKIERRPQLRRSMFVKVQDMENYKEKRWNEVKLQDML